MVPYCFVTCNVRLQTPADGENQFENRVDFLCDTLLARRPDVIGMQELLPGMRRQMMARMPGYAFLGGGRDSARLGESPALAVRQDRLMPERLETQILSPTPHLPGTLYASVQSSCPRAFWSAELMPLDGGRPFRVMNVHTDHIISEARQLQVAQMMGFLTLQNQLRPMPTVITGDFNALPDTLEMAIMQAMEHPRLQDATAGMAGTFHDYGRLEQPEKIDYIWLTEEWTVDRVQALHKQRGGLYLSDHDPIVANVTLHE